MALGCHRFVVFGVRYFQSLCWWLAVLGVLLFRLGEGFMIFQFGVFVFFNNVMFCAYLKFCGVDSGEGMEGIGRDWGDWVKFGGRAVTRDATRDSSARVSDFESRPLCGVSFSCFLHLLFLESI